MRRLESLLIAVTLVLSFLNYLGENYPVGALGLFLALVVHAIVNSPRWQLIPVYAVATVAIAVAGLGIEIGGVTNQLVFWIGGLALVAGTALGVGLPIRRTPELTGPYLVGTSTFHLAQDDRPEIHSSRVGATRELMLQIWYPAVETMQPPAEYLPDHAIGGRALTRAFDMPRFGLNHLNLIRPKARVDPQVASSDELFPVLLFSHGRSGTRVQNTFQIEELVSHGYVVAAVDHPYGAGYTVYPDGRVIDYDHSIFGDDSPEHAGTVIDEWVKDLQWVLDTLDEFDHDEAGQFAGALDLERVGCFGHSAGAGAIIELCYRDSRCGPVVGYDPWVVPTSDETIEYGLDHPLLVLKQEAHLGPTNASRLESLLSGTRAVSYLCEVEDTKHLDFNDYKLLIPALEWIGMTGSIDGDRLRHILNTFTRAFFDTHLRGFPASPVLDRSAFPEVHLRSTSQGWD